MTANTQDGPVMDGAEDATNEEKLHGLIEQVENDHAGEGAGAIADNLRDRAEETGVDLDEPGTSED